MANIGDQLLQPEPGWQRIDDSDYRLIYEGNDWLIYNNSENHYNKTLHCTNKANLNNKVKFKFYGSKIRIIERSGSDHNPTDDKISIDGTIYTINSHDIGGKYTTKALVYENLSLELKVHTIELLSGTNGTYPLSLDAIDIDNNGYIITPIGCQLRQPEDGWKRIDDTNICITYDSSFKVSNTNSYYNSTLHYSDKSGAKISFLFKGTKIRIIANDLSMYPDGVIISIDEKQYTYNMVNKHTNVSNGTQVLLFEKLGLSDCIHKVEITAPNIGLSTHCICLDSIDIDEEGYPVLLEGTYLPNPQTGYTRYSHKNEEFLYLVDTWSEIVDASCYDNSYRVSAGNMNEKFIFRAKTDKVRLICKTDNSFAEKVDLLVDGQLSKTFTLGSSMEKSTIMVCEVNGLIFDVHTFEIKCSNKSSIKKLNIECIDINASGSIESCHVSYNLSKVDEAIRNGNLAVTEDSNAYEGVYIKSCATNSSLVLKFFGQSVKLYFITNSGSKNVLVSIDKQPATKVNCFSNSTLFTQLLYKKSMKLGYHTITISPDAGSYIMNIERIDLDLEGFFIYTEGSLCRKVANGFKRFHSNDSVYTVHPASIHPSQDANATNGYSLCMSNAQGRIEFVTNSSCVRIIARRSSGSVNVFVDNKLYKTLNVERTFNQELGRMIVDIKLSEGIHFIQLVQVNGYLYFEAIDIQKDTYISRDFSLISLTSADIKSYSDTKVEFKNGLTALSNGCGLNLYNLLTSMFQVYLSYSGKNLSGFVLTFYREDGEDISDYIVSFAHDGISSYRNFFADILVSYDGETFVTYKKSVSLTYRGGFAIPLCKKFRFTNFVQVGNSSTAYYNMEIRVGQNIYSKLTKRKIPVTLSSTIIQRNKGQVIVSNIQNDINDIVILNDRQLSLSNGSYLINEEMLIDGINTVFVLDKHLVTKTCFNLYCFGESDYTLEVPLNYSRYEMSSNCFFDEFDGVLKPINETTSRCWVIIPLKELVGKYKISSVVATYCQNLILSQGCYCEYSLTDGATWESDINSLKDIYKYPEILLKVYFFGSLEKISINFAVPMFYVSNLIEVDSPDIGFKKMLQEDKETYITTINDGIAIDDADKDFDLYTAPGNIKLRPLNMGVLVGGKASKVFKFELLSGYAQDYEITLTVCRDGIDAEKDGNCAYLNDFDDKRGQTKVELSLSQENFSPLYPLKIKLGSYDRKIVYIRVTPQSVSSTSTEFQVKAVACPL